MNNLNIKDIAETAYLLGMAKNDLYYSESEFLYSYQFAIRTYSKLNNEDKLYLKDMIKEIKEHVKELY